MTRLSTGIRVRNVNHALEEAIHMTIKVHEAPFWRRKSPRGMPTIERDGLVLTEYTNPKERVLFSAVRDANPFFHFFESLWILDGRMDVAFLATFNKQMEQYSDDGMTFHAPYGYRLRYHFPDGVDGGESKDQIMSVISLLMNEPDTRRAVLCIWDPTIDLNVKSKDIPCNDLIMLKCDDNQLHMTVCCRSNDVLWGAYGANAVQFSVLQEVIATACGFEVGQLTQVSDSYHFYEETPLFKKLQEYAKQGGILICPYELNRVQPYPIMNVPFNIWFQQLRDFMNGGCTVPGSHQWDLNKLDPFWSDVAAPMHRAWVEYKAERTRPDKRSRIQAALCHVELIHATDWQLACREWLLRREEKLNEQLPA